MTIREMTRETGVQVAALEALCFTDAWSERSILAELENPFAIWLTAMEGEQLAGYLGIQYGPDGADIMNIAVDPAFRGQGVARALMEEMLTRLKGMGLKWLTLEVRASNGPAIGLYQRFGFRQVGRRPKYYRKPVEDALLMTKFFEEESGC